MRSPACARPATAFTPLVGAEVSLQPGAPATLPLTPEHEYALLVVDGPVTVRAGSSTAARSLLLGRARRGHLAMSAADRGRLLLLGGEPFEERLVMWWNFIARTTRRSSRRASSG